MLDAVVGSGPRLLQSGGAMIPARVRVVGISK